MNRRVFPGILLVGSLFVQPALAAVIELKDGSQISGQVLSMNDGIYKIYSESAGVLRIPQSKVRAVHENNAALARSTKRSSSSEARAIQESSTPLPASNSSSNISSARSNGQNSFDASNIQQKIIADKGLQQSIMGLQSDPAIQAILQDKAIMDAISRQDYGALSANPKIIELMNNAKIGELTRQLK